MATYAIGDLQGCYDKLRRLLDTIGFDPAEDTLWFVGDLVNRGPDSLGTLRFVRGLADRAVTVLGNHDLHLLALAAGNLRHRHKSNLDPVLEAPDREELILWLRNRPLMHFDPRLGYALIHAGLPPPWDLQTALACAREVETALRGPDYHGFLQELYGDDPDKWTPSLSGMARLRFIINCFTRLRYCRRDGTLALGEKCTPGSETASILPWFAVPDRGTKDIRIVFGHWSTLGYSAAYNTWGLDTGCVWKGRLTAIGIRRDNPTGPVSVSCA